MRDGNAAWRWTAFLADCPGDAWWGVGAGRSEADQFKECLRNQWHADEGSIQAFEGVLDKDLHELPTFGIRALFHSRLVQENMPTFEKVYPWAGAEDCLNWAPAEAVEALKQVEFSSHYKCPSVPTYIKERQSTHGRMLIHRDIQCEHQSSACYSTIHNMQWACGGGLVRTVHCDAQSLPEGQSDIIPDGHSGKFEGACLQETHSAYHVAKPWPGWVSTTTTTTTFHRRFAYLPAQPARPTTAPREQCLCSESGVIRGVDTHRPGCAAHISHHKPFCYIEGGDECHGSKFSRSKNSHYKYC